MGQEPPLGAPYRTNARPPDRARGPRLHVRAGVSVAQRVGAPRLAGLALVAIVTCSFGDLHRTMSQHHAVPTPEVVRAGNLAAVALLASIAVVLLLVRRAWRRLPAARAVKRRSIRRSAALQAAAVVAGTGVVATRSG